MFLYIRCFYLLNVTVYEFLKMQLPSKAPAAVLTEHGLAQPQLVIANHDGSVSSYDLLNNSDLQ